MAAATNGRTNRDETLSWIISINRDVIKIIAMPINGLIFMSFMPGELSSQV
jgi:hypothetical protein